MSTLGVASVVADVLMIATTQIPSVAKTVVVECSNQTFFALHATDTGRNTRRCGRTKEKESRRVDLGVKVTVLCQVRQTCDEW